MTVGIGAKLRYEVLRRDNYTCRFCGSSAPDVFLQIDHVIPRSQGGQDAVSNLQVLCEECNQGKSMTMPERWLVKATQKRQAEWHRANGEWVAPEDDYSEMYAYLEAHDQLSSQSVDEVLRAITHIFAEVFPYRPSNDELLIAAATYIRERPVPRGEPF